MRKDTGLQVIAGPFVWGDGIMQSHFVFSFLQAPGKGRRGQVLLKSWKAWTMIASVIPVLCSPVGMGALYVRI